MQVGLGVQLVALASAGCFTGAVAPQEGATPATAVQPQRASVTWFPPDAPRGVVKIASLGLVELQPPDEAPVSAWLVRVVVSDLADDPPWTLDTRTFALGRGTGNRVTPVLVNADIPTLPTATVERGHPISFDVYFPWPCAAPSLVPRHLEWWISTPDGAFGMLTRLGAPIETARRVGRRDHWWADPAFPWQAYEHRDGVLKPRPPSNATVVTASRVPFEPGTCAAPDPRRSVTPARRSARAPS